MHSIYGNMCNPNPHSSLVCMCKHQGAELLYGIIRTLHYITMANCVITLCNEVAKVMFSQASVCPPQGGGVCLSAWWDTPPWERTPPPWSRHPRSRHPLEQTPPRADNPPWEQTPPRADTSQEQTPPQKQTPPPPEIRPLLRTVRILLECILVFIWKSLTP